MAMQAGEWDVTRKDVTDGLRRLGVEAGDALMVHSSHAAFGRTDGGADAIIDGILDAVGPQGTVVFPTFTGVHIEKLTRPVDRMVPYTGRIPARSRRRPDFVKSHHPLYSIAARGPLAEELCEMNDTYIFASAEDKFLYRMGARGGRVLLLGCTHTSNSAIHVIEEIAGIDYKIQDKPYWKLTVKEFLAMPRDRQIELLDIHMGEKLPYVPSVHFDAMDAPMRKAGAIRTATIGKALCHQMKITDLLRVGAEEAKKDPWFLCDKVGKT